jgi:hypothetical protein
METRSPRYGLLVVALVIGFIVGGIAILYWWSNVPPKRPANVSSRAVFLWAGHLGLPALKHGTWIECWTVSSAGNERCRLTSMDDHVEYEGAFLLNTGKAPVTESELNILSEQTSQHINLWVRVNGSLVPLVFLKSGRVLIPQEAYQEGLAKLAEYDSDRNRK